MSNKKLYEKAEAAIEDLYGDGSVSLEAALDNMRGLADSIEMKIAALEEDLKHEK